MNHPLESVLKWATNSPSSPSFWFNSFPDRLVLGRYRLKIKCFISRPAGYSWHYFLDSLFHYKDKWFQLIPFTDQLVSAGSIFRLECFVLESNTNQRVICWLPLGLRLFPLKVAKTTMEYYHLERREIMKQRSIDRKKGTMGKDKRGKGTKN